MPFLEEMAFFLENLSQTKYKHKNPHKKCKFAG